jgi:hypothetical protein
MVNKTARLFTFGHGFSAAELAALLAPDFALAGSCRSPQKAQALGAQGVEAFVFSGKTPLEGIGAALQGTTHLLLSIPPDAMGDPVLRQHAGDIVALAPSLEWMGYLSTTGVYGDREGEWVDEETTLAPSTERGARRLAAEASWRSLSERHGLPLHIFRLAGIYGPMRNQLVAMRDGTARRIVKERQVFSRIHVEDVAQVLAASISQPNPGAAYNVCDDLPAPPQDVVAFAAELLHQPLPPAIAFDSAELSPMARSFYAESKRVCNRRIRDELGVNLLYPTFREGLRALFERGEY